MSGIEAIYRSYAASEFETISLSRIVSAVRAAPDLNMWLHPLGFYHAELTDLAGSPPGERFRLHIWLDSKGVGDDLGNLHEHTWHLTSLVLAGQVEDIDLLAVESASGKYSGSRIIYGDVNGADVAGRFDLAEVQRRSIGVGDVYTIPSRTVHLNSVSRLPTVTLVRSVEDARGDGPLVLTLHSASGGFATGTRKKVDVDDVLDRLLSMVG